MKYNGQLDGFTYLTHQSKYRDVYDLPGEVDCGFKIDLHLQSSGGPFLPPTLSLDQSRTECTSKDEKVLGSKIKKRGNGSKYCVLMVI